MGDVCDNDLDGDGVIDGQDNCPKNRFRHKPSFSKYLTVDMDPNLGEPAPVWLVLDQGREIRLANPTNASSLVVGGSHG